MGAAARTPGTAATPKPVKTHHGPTGGHASRADEESRADFVNEALRHAWEMSYAMSPHAWWSRHFGDHPESALGGPFLRMYLEHKLDPNLVAQAGTEIGESKDFQALAKDTGDALGARARHVHKRLPTPAEVEVDARDYLQERKHKRGIAFRGALNPVIGGITGIDVLKGSAQLMPWDANKGKGLDFVIRVKVSDTYDFTNKRTGVYDAYRKHLADLIRKGKFHDFWSAYRGAIAGPLLRKLHLGKAPPASSIGNAGVFASFMYALEVNQITPGGLPWDVTVPMKGSVSLTEPAVHPHTGQKH